MTTRQSHIKTEEDGEKNKLIPTADGVGSLHLTLFVLAGIVCVRRGGAVVFTADGSWGGCWVPAPVMGMFWTEMPCGVM